MSCCSSGGTCKCPIQPCPSKYVVAWFPRIAFGLVLAGYGVNHYMNLSQFVGMAKGVYPSVPVLGSIAGILAYIVPALMIVGGVLFAIRQLCCISKICIVAALAGIIGWAGLAVMVGDSSSGGTMMPLIQNAVILFLFYGMIKKMSCKAGCMCKPGACMCKDGNCTCAAKPGMPSMK